LVATGGLVCQVITGDLVGDFPTRINSKPLRMMLSFLRGLARRHDINVELSQVGMADRLSPETEVTAYRIVQEALTNVARHARATRCRVRLLRLPSALKVEVEDDGAGFASDEGATTTGGYGLIGMRERAAMLGGSLQIDSAPGLGTRLIVELPAGVLLG